MSHEVTIKKRIEALLFATNRPLDIVELCHVLGDLPMLDVQDALVELRRDYAERSGALVISESSKGANPAYFLEVRREYMPDLQRLLPLPLEPRCVETLVLIALNQPVTQSRLVRDVGSRVYDDVKVLVDRNLVQRIRRRRTYSLRTTPKFAQDFGFEDNPEIIKKEIAAWAEREGIDVGPMRQVAAEPAPENAEATESVEGEEKLTAAAEASPAGSEPSSRVSAAFAALSAEATAASPEGSEPSAVAPRTESEIAALTPSGRARYGLVESSAHRVPGAEETRAEGDDAEAVARAVEEACAAAEAAVAAAAAAAESEPEPVGCVTEAETETQTETEAEAEPAAEAEPPAPESKDDAGEPAKLVEEEVSA